MVLTNERMFNQLVAKTKKILKLFGADLPTSVIKHLLAKSQGFETGEQLTTALPIEYRASESTNQFFINQIELYLTNFTDKRYGRDYVTPSHAVDEAISEVTPFPITAESGATVFLEVFFRYGTVLKPRVLSEREESKSADALLDRPTSLFPLSAHVTKNDYLRLKSLIEPVLKRAQRDERGVLIFQGDIFGLRNDVAQVIKQFAYERVT